MGMFWMQLRQLMWKNLLIRKRSKVWCHDFLFQRVFSNCLITKINLQIRVITELVWPIILFVILALVRYVKLTKNLSFPCTIISNVILFFLMFRTKGLKDYKNECKLSGFVHWSCKRIKSNPFSGFLEEKALPSAGSLNFLQSLICTFDNNCHNSPPSANRLSEEFELSRLLDQV
jgi:hypothetical protein